MDRPWIRGEHWWEHCETPDNTGRRQEMQRGMWWTELHNVLPPPNPSRTLTGAVLGVASSTSHRAMVWGSRAHQLLLFPFGLGSCHFLPRSGREADYLLWAFGKPPLKSFPLFNVVPSRGVPLWTSQCLTFSLSEVFFWLGYSICTSYFSAISAPGEQKLTWITGRVPEKTQTFLTPTQFSQAQPNRHCKKDPHEPCSLVSSANKSFVPCGPPLDSYCWI